jgi:hypothetical protein
LLAVAVAAAIVLETVAAVEQADIEHLVYLWPQQLIQ